MIRYALTCPKDHSFESWFQSAEAFDRLAALGQVTCAVCGASGVSKSLMAPSVRAARKAGEAEPQPRPLSTPRTRPKRRWRRCAARSRKTRNMSA
ncbi:hypothetical protein AKL17_3491 [Frigidibacter mobilis]|uniref:DUF1178 family protein n=1 Tax=Frigidibacter mobilis TaxID=1335048 RepID=A0A159Z5Z6_9RHOB|nr:hypothetical protein AKL17_3491 [Frigidibacter mobilis]